MHFGVLRRTCHCDCWSLKNCIKCNSIVLKFEQVIDEKDIHQTFLPFRERVKDRLQLVEEVISQDLLVLLQSHFTQQFSYLEAGETDTSLNSSVI